MTGRDAKVQVGLGYSLVVLLFFDFIF